LAFKYEQIGENERAIDIFTKIKKLRSEEPQSHRDLAISLVRRGNKDDIEKAINLLQDVIKGEWDIRFSQVEIVSLMDLNRIISMMKWKGFNFQNQQNIQIDRRLIYEIDVDIRVILMWDTDMIDLELHCTEPNGEICNSLHNHTCSGGLLSKDFTGGYGPQEYLLRKANPGKYSFSCRVYSPIIASMGGATTAILRIYTNCGRSNEEERIITQVITKPGQMTEVATIEWI